MKKVLFPSALMAIAAFGICTAASATSFSLNASHNKSPYIVESDSVTDYVANVTVKNNSTCSGKGCTAPVSLDSIEVWFGGTSKGVGDSYDLDATSLGNLRQTGDVTVNSGNPGDQIVSAELINNASSGFCYVGETLAKGGTCELELLLGVKGVAPTGKKSPGDKNSSVTDIFTQVDGSNGTSHSTSFALDIDYAPEPGAPVLMGAGFALLGFGLFLRRRRASGQVAKNNFTIA